MRWEILAKKSKDVVKTLLKNRWIKNEKEFFNPQNPHSIKLKALGIKDSEIKKAIGRIKLAKKRREKIIIYGDYDADGICATAIMWECLHEYGLDVLPHIPDRFSEGYGINSESIKNLKLKIKNLSLVITVDNGIVGYDGVKKAKELGIDVIVIDHHIRGKRRLPTSYILHLTSLSGAGLSYFFAKELGYKAGLELATIGTIADQMPLTGVNRSIVKYGLKNLRNSKRPGLKALFEEARIKDTGTYEVNYMIAPRLNAMGRMAQGIDSLRLLCTKSPIKARELSKLLGDTNYDRQMVVENVVSHAREKVGNQKIIVIAHENYHEGVIGLAAGRLTEEFYKPAIVFSKKNKVSKASARSISGFDIINAIRNLDDLILEGGGHPMAAGFSIETSKIEIFSQKINEIADRILTDELLVKKLKVDCEINFEEISPELVEKISQFEPFGLGNPTPTFMSKKVELLESKAVGKNLSHLKLKLRQSNFVFDAIYFNAQPSHLAIQPSSHIDLVYSIEENIWNNHRTLQLKIKDVKII